MPEVGESDVGLFCLSAAAYHDLLPQFARIEEAGSVTSERTVRRGLRLETGSWNIIATSR